MSAQPQSIGTIAFAIASFLAAVLAISVPPNVALAVDCLTAPDSPAPPNGHWYYTTDRMQQRKCWHLRTDSALSEQGTLQTAREAPAKPSQSVAAGDQYAGPGFKGFVVQRDGAKLSDEDVAKLYAEFLEWKRRTKN